jgi:hypothetical protein
MKTLLTALAATVASAISFAPAFAAGPPPVSIDKCVIGQVKTGDDTVIGHGVAFTNTSHHVITDIRFNFTFETKFNDILGGTLETDSGTFSPGIAIDHTTKSAIKPGFSFGPGAKLQSYYWQVANPSQDAIASMKVVCTVDAISFQDGTVWTAPK